MLVAGAIAAPAGAAKRKKPPSPVTFEASGSFANGDPLEAYVDFLPAKRSGVTANDFAMSCAIPASQGFDGYVVKLPDRLSPGSADVQLEADELVGGKHLYMTLYDSNCAMTGRLSDAGRLDAGTKYILVTGWPGAQVTFHLTVVESR
jgi:hypothetical protein